MKCPKCGYLGFEATERCRNCGYDFSLAAPAPSAELPLRTSEPEAPLADLALAPAAVGSEVDADADARPLAAPPLADPQSQPFARTREEAAVTDAVAAGRAGERGDDGDLPLFSPRPAGTPLAVRRQGPDVPRARRTTTRPVRVESPVLPLMPESAETEADPLKHPRRRALPAAATGSRLLAAGIDLVVLAVIDLLILWLTLRLAGLTASGEDLRVIRAVPMAGFLMVLAFLYLAGFTVGGGQTIGKMLTGIRVAGDDGRGVDITGAVVRALGVMAAVATCGVLFLPAVVGADRRALHDRLAGTRVVTW